MYRTKPYGDCDMPNPDLALRALVLNASLKHEPTQHMAKNLARNTPYDSQLLMEHPLVPQVAAHG